ncbi:MAG: DegV family protein [Candidatus Phytoplasma pyri]
MNKRKLGIVVDSACNKNEMKKLFPDISIVPIQIIIENNIYEKDDIKNEYLLECMKQKKKIKTSQPSPNLFVKAFEKQLDLGYEKIVCFTLSKKLSGTNNSANVAKNILNDPRITIFDTNNIGPGTDYILKNLKNHLDNENNEDSLEYEEIINKILKSTEKNLCYMYLDSLNYLLNQGRISKVKTFIGNFFKIKPIVELKNGALSIKKKVRSLKKCFTYLIETIKDYHNQNKFIEIYFQYLNKNENIIEFEKKLKNLKNDKLKIYSSEYCSSISINLGYDSFAISLFIDEFSTKK